MWQKQGEAPSSLRSVHWKKSRIGEPSRPSNESFSSSNMFYPSLSPSWMVRCWNWGVGAGDGLGGQLRKPVLLHPLLFPFLEPVSQQTLSQDFCFVCFNWGLDTLIVIYCISLLWAWRTFSGINIRPVILEIKCVFIKNLILTPSVSKAFPSLAN